MLSWDERYELGHERIDAEHRIFLSLLGDFELAMKNGLPKDKQIRILQEIAKYADFHFLSEENIMADCHYPDLDHHVGMHTVLLDQVKDYSTRFRLDEINGTEVFEFLFSWFALHTSSEDKKLVGFVSSQKNI